MSGITPQSGNAQPAANDEVSRTAAEVAAAEADANIEKLEVAHGRRYQAPYARHPHWVSLAPIRHQSVRLYTFLAAHINNDRRKKDDDREVWPTMNDLAEMMGFTRRDKVKPFIDELKAIGAIDVEQIPVAGGGKRTRSKYVVHETPPPGYEGHETLGDFYAAKRARRKAARQAAVAAAAVESEGEPEGESEGETADHRYLKWGTGPVPQMRCRSGTSNEVPNKMKQPDEGELDGGGHPPPPPNPPADLTATHLSDVPPSVLGSSGDQQTARVPKLRRPARQAPGHGGRLRSAFEAQRRAAAECPHCDDAGLTPGGASCPHEPRQKPTQHGPESTQTNEPVSAG